MCVQNLVPTAGSSSVSGQFTNVNRRKRERNDAPVVTGRQTGVENPIDTSKVTKRLKKQRGQQVEKRKKLSGRSPLDLKIM